MAGMCRRTLGAFGAVLALVLMVVAPAVARNTSPGLLRGPSEAASLASEDAGRIDAFVTAEMDAVGVPGVALAVVEEGAVVYAKGFGAADASGRAVTAQTPFIIGSLSKSFTAVAILQLVEAGKIDLDAPVQRYLPWFAVADSAASARITVRHLLNQTSGLSTQAGDSNEQWGHGSDALERNVRALAGFPLTAPVGSAFQYSNANYQVLGLIVQVVSGQPYGAYVQQHVFEPLEMQHSFADLASARADGLTLGHRTSVFGGPVAATDWPYLEGALPSGFLVSSAEDMAHYLVAQLDGGRYGQRAILSPSSITLLHTPPADVPDTSYAMGWLTDSLGNTPTLGHSGTTPGTTSAMTLVPGRNLGVIVLTNEHSPTDGSRLAGISDAVATMLIGGTWTAPPPDAGILSTLIIAAVLLAWQLVTLALGVWFFRHPARRRRGRAAIIAGLALVDVSALVVCLVVVPAIGGAGLRILIFYQPDLYLTVVGVTAFGLVWGVVRTLLLTLRLVRQPDAAVMRQHAAAAT